jgi:uncharacterized membrane protein YbaN (DUF454 family)
VKARLKRWGILAVGWAFILLGIAGLFLPILQGILFLLIGLFILSTEYVWAHHLLLKLKQRFPAVARHADAARSRAEEKLARWFHRGKASARDAKAADDKP